METTWKRIGAASHDDRIVPTGARKGSAERKKEKKLEGEDS